MARFWQWLSGEADACVRAPDSPSDQPGIAAFPAQAVAATVRSYRCGRGRAAPRLSAASAAGRAWRDRRGLELLEVLEHLDHGVTRVCVRLVIDGAPHGEAQLGAKLR